MNIKNKFLILAVILVSSFAAAQKTLETLYGNFTITEPVLLDVLESSCLNRLRYIHQYGVDNYAIKEQDYFRYNHSVGVFVLLRAYGAPVHEQIAGLLHDASHTIFSHVGDQVFDHPDAKNSYQDDIHEWYLKKTDIGDILSQHAITIPEILAKNKQFTALEQDLPDICADRLEYNLQGGLLEGLITHHEIAEILATLRFENGCWYFTDTEQAKKFARISLYMTEHRWGSADGLLIDWFAAQALKRALHLNLITLHDIHFSVDAVVWKKLCESTDAIISENIIKIMNGKNVYTLSNTRDFDLVLHGKFRGIDPLVQLKTGFVRLSEIDTEFNAEFVKLKNLMQHGWYIKFL